MWFLCGLVGFVGGVVRHLCLCLHAVVVCDTLDGYGVRTVVWWCGCCVWHAGVLCADLFLLAGAVGWGVSDQNG